jgi:hypothetical protein
MLAIVVQLAPEVSSTTVAIARVAGWIGARLDDIATALMIGIGPLFISLAGRGTWVPAWLLGWSWLAALLGALSIVVLYVPGLRGVAFLVVPVGVGWMVAAGAVVGRGRPVRD